ncbi:hypothetical protein RHMOL_Rhmol04G0005000 [Rhododendron molle]|uniref:Uncharacterized protein n=1 Tax=Rhododendron molle TaxID=49168 RepID=A0ACC0NVJ6_RHOML|nr:hypothetical protein RHMOL_Rhmol04G0005000 [Rhododendron molle]
MPAISLSSSAAVSSTTISLPLPLPRHHRHCPRTPTAHLRRPLQALQSASTRRHRKCSLGSDIWLLLTTTPSPSESGGGWYYPQPNGYNFPAPPPPFPILPYCPYYYYTPLPSDFMNSSVLSAKHFVFVTLHPFEQGEEKGTTHEGGFSDGDWVVAWWFGIVVVTVMEVAKSVVEEEQEEEAVGTTGKAEHTKIIDVVWLSGPERAHMI